MRPELSDIRAAFRTSRAELWNITLEEMETTLTICETLEYNWANKIKLFQFKARWGFCLHVWPGGDEAGKFYGPLFSFCDPFEDRISAIESAVSILLAVYGQSKRPEAKKMSAWATGLITHQQLRMI